MNYSPPPFDYDSEPSNKIQTISNLKFIFKPTRAEYNDNIQMNLNKSQCSKALDKKMKGHLKEKIDSKKKSVMGLPKRKIRSRKSLNHVWATKLTKKKKRKTHSLFETHCLRQSPFEAQKKRNSISNVALFASVKLTKLSKEMINKAISPSKQIHPSELTNMSSSIEKTLSQDNLNLAQVESESSQNIPQAHLSENFISALNSIEKGTNPQQIMSNNKAKSSTTSGIKNKVDILTKKSINKLNIKSPNHRMTRNSQYCIANTFNSANVNSHLQTPSVDLDENTDDSILYGSQCNFDISNQINEIETDSLSKKQPKRSQPSKLYYPVHPYTSPDLPVHFIPIDTENMPKIFPLYYPTVGMKNTSEIYPTFIQFKSSDEPSLPRHSFTNALQSSSIPHQTLPAQDVFPRIFPGIASGSGCPLVPDVSSAMLEPLQRQNTSFQAKLDDNSSNAINGVLTTQNYLAQLTKGLPKPSITLIKRSLEDQSKIHKCPNCSFETPKLGVLKRHQSSHAKESSNKSLVAEAQSESCNEPATQIYSSVTINTTNQMVQTDQATPIVQSTSPMATTSIKIVSAESLKDTANEVQQTFKNLSPNSSVHYKERLPSVTITPLLRTFD